MPGPAARRRLLIKLSGEALLGGSTSGIDPAILSCFSQQLATLVDHGNEVGVVVGGGNFLRGQTLSASGMDRVTADHMGMLATVMNALAIGDGVRLAGAHAVVFSALPLPQICEVFSAHAARAALTRGDVAVFAGGTGNPFFTTDSTAALRAAEINADGLYKATQVDGVYDADPKTNPGAKRFDRLSFDEVLARDLKVMDAAAIAIARDNRIPIMVFSIQGETAIVDAVEGRAPATRIDAD